MSWAISVPSLPLIAASKVNTTNGRALLNPSATELRIGGITRLSTCDWPGELVATIFCQGCAWGCPYCHNAALRPALSDTAIAWHDVFEFLRSRRGLLDAVVFSGGEPTQQPAIVAAVQAVRSLSFRVGMHSAGIFPQRFASLLPLLDWVGFDIKAPFDDYARITGSPNSGHAARQSLIALLASNLPYELRTTVHSDLLSTADLERIRDQLKQLHASNLVLQNYQTPQFHTSAELGPSMPVNCHFTEDFQHFTIR